MDQGKELQKRTRVDKIRTQKSSYVQVFIGTWSNCWTLQEF